MLKKKKTPTSRLNTMPFSPNQLTLKLPPSQSLASALQPSPIQNTTSHHATPIKPPWLNRRSAFIAQTSTTVSTHAHTSFTIHKYQWFKLKTWTSWATNNAPQDQTVSS